MKRKSVLEILSEGLSYLEDLQTAPAAGARIREIAETGQKELVRLLGELRAAIEFTSLDALLAEEAAGLDLSERFVVPSGRLWQRAACSS